VEQGAFIGVGVEAQIMGGITKGLFDHFQHIMAVVKDSQLKTIQHQFLMDLIYWRQLKPEQQQYANLLYIPRVRLWSKVRD